MRSNILRVIPKTYKLFFDKQALKNINPYLNVSSGSYANMSRVITYEGDKPKVETTQEAKNNVFVELRDADTGRLLGKSQIQYDSLPEQKCNFEETVPLRNQAGEEIGEAVLEVQVAPRKSGFLGFWEEKPQLEAEEKAAETKKLEGNEDAKTLKSESESAQKEEPVMKSEATKKEEPVKTAGASKEGNEKAVKSQEIKSRDHSLEDDFPMARDVFYDFEKSRREMDRIFHNFENVFGDRMFSGFGDEFRRVMRTFDRLEREMFRDLNDFMLPLRRGRYYLDEEMPIRRSLEGKGEKKAEGKSEGKVEKEHKGESKQEKSA